MSGASDLWVDIFSSKYGTSKIYFMCGGRYLGLHFVSFWWKGVSFLGSKKEDPLNWFGERFVKKVRNVCRHPLGKTLG